MVDYRFGWVVPGLTFTRRMGELLDAMESMGRAVALRETSGDYGIAIDSASQRVTFSRNALTINLQGPDVPVPDGVWEPVWAAMEPESVALERLRTVLTSGYSSGYDLTTAHFARVVSGLGAPLRPTDAAVLLDLSLEDDGGVAQVEYGIVRPQEFRDRLARPSTGMAKVGRSAMLDVDVSQLPPASLFVDINCSTYLPVDSFNEVVSTCLRADRVPTTLTETLRAKLAMTE
jgi:hypothetical protein